MRVIISGGGSGGHIFPAIAVADTLKSLRPDVEILFVGAKGRMEMEKVPRAGYPIEGLWISGLHRKITLRNLLFPAKVIVSLLKSRTLLKKYRPDAVAGFGGYASAPIVRVAASKGIATLIQEQNSFPGISNRWLSGKVDKICVAFDKMDRFFPKEKLVQTGNPVRKELAGASKEEGLNFFGLSPGAKTLLVFGGSLGARSLNEMMDKAAPYFKGNKEYQVVWQCGSLYVEKFSDSETAKLENVRFMPFIDRMDLAYAAADLAVCRAGASTIAELCLTGQPAVLIPSPNVAEDHQTKNARSLEEKNAVEILADKTDDREKIERILDLLKNKEKLSEMHNAMAALARPEAAKNIAFEILKMIE